MLAWKTSAWVTAAALQVAANPEKHRACG